MEQEPAGTIRRSIIRIDQADSKDIEDVIVEEIPLTVFLNGRELVTMLCSPGGEKHLVIGFLKAEGMIDDIHDIAELRLELDRGLVWAESKEVKPEPAQMYLKRCLTACCGKGRVGFYYAGDNRTARRVDSKLTITSAEAVAYAALLDEAAHLFRLTGGVHSGALAAGGKLICHSYDIGRHNVLDKLYGHCLLYDIDTADKLLVFSGRVSSEIVLKVSKMNIPVIIAYSAPTALALGLADDLGITVIGFARGSRFNLYTHSERLK